MTITLYCSVCSTSFGPELTRSVAHAAHPTVISNPDSPLSESVKEEAKLYCVSNDVDSPFRNHDGLYDGTGYGRSSASASRPATAVAEMVTPGADIPGCYHNGEAEGSKVEEKL